MSEEMEQICVGHDGDVSFVSIACDSESNSFWGHVLPLVRGRHLVLDLALWRGDTGFLVQELLLLTSMLQRRETRLWLARVPLTIARRLSNQKRKISGASFLSVEAPYYCTVCACDRFVVLDITPELIRRSHNVEESIPAQTCPQCFSEMQFNESPQGFLAFMDLFAAPVGPGGLRNSAELAQQKSRAVSMVEPVKKPPESQKHSDRSADLYPLNEEGSSFVVIESCIATTLFLGDLWLMWALF